MTTFGLSAAEVDDLRDVVDLCREPVDDPEGRAWAVLDRLQVLVGSDGVALNGMDTRRGTHYHQQFSASGDRWTRGEDEALGTDEAFWHHYARCRPCEYPDHVDGAVVVTIGDFYSRREWRRHPMRSEVLTDVDDEVVVAWPDGAGRSVRLLFPRAGARPFGDRERFLLTLLAPSLQPLLRAARRPPEVLRPAITERQWQVLERVRVGLADKQIARELGLSPATVRKHLENVFRTLEVQSRSAAVHVAFGEAGADVREVAG